MNIEKEIYYCVSIAVIVSVRDSVYDSVSDYVWRCDAVWDSALDSMRGSVDRSLADTVDNSISEYEY